MELQTLLTIVGICSPLIMAAVGWGAFRARLAALERGHGDHEQRLRHIERGRPRQEALL